MGLEDGVFFCLAEAPSMDRRDRDEKPVLEEKRRQGASQFFARSEAANWRPKALDWQGFFTSVNYLMANFILKIKNLN